jgi:class 3 adenylate cyclase
MDNVELYVAKIQIQVMKYRDAIEHAYEKYPESNRFWAMIDLVGSSNYRLLKGPAKGYLRGETFFSLANEVITPYVEIELIKEIGDAVLLAADSLRPLLESLVLADQAAFEMRLLAGEEKFPFAIRAGISYGPAKRLNRPHKPQDYLGTPLDQLARIMGVRSSESNLLLHEAAYRSQEAIIKEYGEVISISESKALSGSESKGMLENVYYRELKVDRPALREFDKYFFPWRERRGPD